MTCPWPIYWYGCTAIDLSSTTTRFPRKPGKLCEYTCFGRETIKDKKREYNWTIELTLLFCHAALHYRVFMSRLVTKTQPNYCLQRLGRRSSFVVIPRLQASTSYVGSPLVVCRSWSSSNPWGVRASCCCFSKNGPCSPPASQPRKAYISSASVHRASFQSTYLEASVFGPSRPRCLRLLPHRLPSWKTIWRRLLRFPWLLMCANSSNQNLFPMLNFHL